MITTTRHNVNTEDNTAAALELAAMGYYVHPLKPGTKAPRTENGHLDATRDEQTIRQWWALCPDAGIGIALAASGLLIVGPDCETRLSDFTRRGLPETTTVQSGSGEGHQHHYYRLPDGGPVGRMCRSGDYDLLSDGYIVAPPSKTTGAYIYLTALRPVDDLPVAPPWAVTMLREHVARRAAADAFNAPVAGDSEPPVRLSASAREWWDGTRQASDRSGTLYALAKELYRAGATISTIARALHERDVALHTPPKYAHRTDAAIRYAETASRAAADVEAEAVEPTIHFTQGDDCDADCLRRIAELDQQLAQVTEELEYARELNSTTWQVLRSDCWAAGEKLSILATINYVTSAAATGNQPTTEDGYTRVPAAAIADTGRRDENGKPITWTSPATIGRHQKLAAEAGLIERRTQSGFRRDVDPDTGEITRGPYLSETYIRLASEPGDVLKTMTTVAPDRPRQGGSTRIVACDTCGDDTEVEVHVTETYVCAGCGEIIGTATRKRRASDIERMTPGANFNMKSAISDSGTGSTVERYKGDDLEIGPEPTWLTAQGADTANRGFHDEITSADAEKEHSQDVQGLCRDCHRPLRNAIERASGVHSYNCTTDYRQRAEAPDNRPLFAAAAGGDA